MNINEFWNIINKGKSSAESTAIIREEINKLPSTEVISYQQHFNQLVVQAYQWDLWGAAYIIGGGCSDDGFMDFRYGLIAKGKEIYDSALINPDSLAEIGVDVEIENELFGYIAQDVYQELTGKEMPVTETNVSDGPSGKEWDFDNEDECNKQLPQLSKLYM